MDVIAKKSVRRTVDIVIRLLSARVCTTHCPEGLWQSLKRKSVISRKGFPEGSYVVVVMYIEGDQQQSGAAHYNELPLEVRKSLDATGFWKDGDA